MDKDLRFDPTQNLLPVITLVSSRLFLASPVSAPWKSVNEMVAYSRANPGKLNYGAVNESAQFRNEAFLFQYGLKFTPVSYKSTPDNVRGLITGEVHISWLGYPLVRGAKDRLRVIAVTGESRFPDMPEAPTFKELGLTFSGVDYVLSLPVGTPKPVVDKLNAAALSALRNADVKAQIEKLELDVVGDTPALAQKRLLDETRMYGDIAQKIGYKPQGQ
jgi:tripartite-type tricarboxylate transporter receptor subunit TctC